MYKIKKKLTLLHLRKNKKILLGISILLVGLILAVTFSTNISEEVKSVEIVSNDWDATNPTPGSWHIDKSAEWIDGLTAQIKFDVNTVLKTTDNLKDIILILDVSGSMSGDKLDKVKSDATELTEFVLSDPRNRIALIKFDTNAEILSEFTNDKDKIVNEISKLTTDAGTTNYADALRKTNEVLDGYTPQNGTDAVALFLSDGYPCEDTPNQIGEYAILKENHPYLTVNGIQYEMGSVPVKELVEISDNQYLAYIDNLKNVLFEASISYESYEYFTVVDYIKDENFIVNSKDDIKVSRGTFDFDYDTQKITWYLGTWDEENDTGTFNTGSSATMTINATLKEEHRNKKGFYDTNTKEEIRTKIPDENPNDKDSPSTPVLYNGYDVIYDTNPPSNCNIKEAITETHTYLDLVTLRSDAPTCEGYQFKGWEIIEEDNPYVTKINDNQFRMPKQTVHIKATWTKLAISKSMTGTVFERKGMNLLNEIKNNNSWVVDSSLNFSDTTAAGTAGYYIRLGTETKTADYQGEPIYYYRGAVTNNYVIFAEMCWRIVRTTETGGIKLIYSGKDDGGKCTATGTGVQLQTSAFNSTSNTAAYVGYMYNANITEKTSDDMIAAGKTSADVNKDDSDIKKVIDPWYKTNIDDKGYTSMLEDAVWCNDRSQDKLTASGSTTYFGSYKRNTTQTTTSTADSHYVTDEKACPNQIDRFTVKDTNKGNGALTYPVGLVTADEVSLAGLGHNGCSSSSWLDSGQYVRSLSPGYLYGSGSYVWRWGSNGLGNYNVHVSYGVRPAVSLAPGTLFYEGDGSMNDPYVVD